MISRVLKYTQSLHTKNRSIIGQAMPEAKFNTMEGTAWIGYFASSLAARISYILTVGSCINVSSGLGFGIK